MALTRILTHRNFAGLIAANTLLGAAFPIQLVLGGLAGLMLAPGAGLATLPASLQTLAGLFAAAPVSLLMARAGRRAGFALGAGLTLLGAVAAVQALYSANFVLLCAAHLAFGAGWAAFQFFRFAAAEVVPPDWRPVAISLMLSSLLVSALLGPQVFIAARDLLAPIPFAGAYAAVGVIAFLGVLPLALVRTPKPPRPDRSVAQSGGRLAALRRPDGRRAVFIAAISQGVMVFLMVPTPIAIIGCGFSEDMASDVIRWHIVAMFAPSFFTGFLIRRFGAERIAALGLGLLVLSALIAALGLTELHFYGSLIILGLGWNFGFISATTMLDAAISEEEKGAVQGLNDTVIALVATLCAFASGLVLSSFGWAVLAGLSGGAVLLALIALFLRPAPQKQT